MYNPVDMESLRTTGRLLAVDWGEKKIGLAISDETQTLAKPLKVMKAGSRAENANKIVEFAEQNNCVRIIVGVSYDLEGNLSPSGRRGDRLAKEVRSKVTIPVLTVDESFSTNEALSHQIIIGAARKKRRGHLDDKAAAFFLQSYLDRHNTQDKKNE